jgi:hypothetical protein
VSQLPQILPILPPQRSHRRLGTLCAFRGFFVCVCMKHAAVCNDCRPRRDGENEESVLNSDCKMKFVLYQVRSLEIRGIAGFSA